MENVEFYCCKLNFYDQYKILVYASRPGRDGTPVSAGPTSYVTRKLADDSSPFCNV